MKCTAKGWSGLAGWIVLGTLAAGPSLRGEDVTTLAGTTYRQVQAVRVEPDGVTWTHATGVVKVDFTDLPEAVRRAYHYDAGKAAAFQAAQARTRQEAEARAQGAQRETETRRVQQFQAAQVASVAAGKPGEFVFQRRAAETAAVESVGKGIADKQAAEAFRTKDDGTVWDRRLWAVPVFLFGGSPVNGVAFDPKTDLDAHAFAGSVHHAPGGVAPDAAHDAFYQPDYLTKAYQKDLDRAAAFARGRP